jgi:hypothetical protein
MELRSGKAIAIVRSCGTFPDNDDAWIRVSCFAERANAETFQANGLISSIKRRGLGWAKLKEPKKRLY